MMRHPGFGTLVRYADEELAAKERARVARHLLVCTRCRAELEGMGRLRARLARAPEPDNALLERVLAARETGARVVLPGAEPVRPPRSSTGWIVGIGAAAIVGALLLPTGESGNGEECMPMGPREFAPVAAFAVSVACAAEPVTLPDSMFEPVSQLEVRQDLPGRVVYSNARWTDGEVESYQGTTEVTFDRTRLDDAPGWTGVGRVAGPYVGVTIDTLIFAARDASELSYYSRTRPRGRGTWSRVLYGQNSVRMMHLGQDNRPVHSERGRSDGLADGVRFMPWWRLPHGLAILTTLPLHDGSIGAVEDLRFRVLGRETITVPAGTFDTWYVELTGWGVMRAWIAAAQPVVVRIEWGNMADRFESVLTELEP